MPRAVLCPYCGVVSGTVHRCTGCGGHLDALSRQATQNAMGPWYVRDEQQPHRPGCSYDTLSKLCEQGKVTTESVVRGPGTGQFWMLARRVPGIAHRLGVCHSCQAPAKPDEYACRACGALFAGERDRQHLGLGPIRPLPGQESPEMVAARLSVKMPPIPTPGVGRNGANVVVNGSRPGAGAGAAGAGADGERLRKVEKRVVALRSRLVGSLCANIVLAAAMVVAVTLLATRPTETPSLTTGPAVRDPLYVGPGATLVDPMDEVIDESSGDVEPGAPGVVDDEDAPPMEEPSEPLPIEDVTPPAPDRGLDITLMSWTDAEAWVRAQVDESDAESVRRGLAMLTEYEAANGLPEAGDELRRAWEFRLEQLRLQGLP